MHTPDGFLTSWLCIVMLMASLMPVALALRNLVRAITKEKALSIATVSSLIFIAQMLNFPVANGTSGHLIGAAFALIILGIDGAIIALASVLLVQAFVFGDGGVLALGANIFNMAIVGSYTAHFVYAKYKNALAASWASVFTASLSCTLLLVLSGTVQLIPALISMVSVHAIIGIGEGLITIILVNALTERFKNQNQNRSFDVALGIVGLSFLALAVLLPFASSEPDGLERVAINFGFFEKAITIYDAPFQDYTLFTGVIGALAVFAITYSALNLKIFYPELA